MIDKIIASDDAPGVSQLEDKIKRFIAYEASQSYFEDWAPNPDYVDASHRVSSSLSPPNQIPKNCTEHNIKDTHALA